jgi:DNA-binding SARP family transcriptional activator
LAVIDYRLLGPIEAGVDGRTLDIGGRKQRALLAVLLLSANEPVSRDCLAERLWGERPPAGAQHTLEVYVSRLRKVLEPAAGCEVVLTRPGAYLLSMAPPVLRAAAAPPSGRTATSLAIYRVKGPLLCGKLISDQGR